MLFRSSAVNLYAYIYWGILMTLKGLNLYVSESSPMLLLVLASFAVVKIILDKYSLKEIGIISGLMIYVVIFWYHTGNFTSAFTIVTIIIVSNTNMDYLCKIAFLIRGLLYAVRVVLAFLGVNLLRQVIYTNERRRYNLGFSHPNLAHYEFFVIVIFFFLYKRGKLSDRDYIVILGLNALLYYFTRSRTSFILVTFLYAFNLLFPVGFRKKVLKKFASAVYPFLSIASILLSLLARSVSWFPYLGTFFSRFLRGNYLIHMGKLSLLGNRLDYDTDNGYVNMICLQGIIIFALFIMSNTKLTKKCIQIERWDIVVVLVCIGIHFCMEAFADSILLNPALIYMSWLIRRKDFFRLRTLNKNEVVRLHSTDIR